MGNEEYPRLIGSDVPILDTALQNHLLEKERHRRHIKGKRREHKRDFPTGMQNFFSRRKGRKEDV
ncbi:MAG: hypothetical protein GY861_25230 [bacterium]|nr:hypothetical protein [bacterium]